MRSLLESASFRNLYITIGCFILWIGITRPRFQALASPMKVNILRCVCLFNWLITFLTEHPVANRVLAFGFTLVLLIEWYQSHSRGGSKA